MRKSSALTKTTPFYKTWISFLTDNIIRVIQLPFSPQHLLPSQREKSMYHHAITNINSQSSDHASLSTKSSETRRREIPLAFTNTGWGREYIANSHWKQENHGKSTVPVRQGSRVQPVKDGRSIPATVPSHSASKTSSANTLVDSHSSSTALSTIPPVPTQSSQQYSVMTAWNFFRRTFPHPTSPTSSNTPDLEYLNVAHPEQDEIVELGPWLEMLMRWDDFEQWQLKMLQRSWCLPGTP
jgi:hypothetical protein